MTFESSQTYRDFIPVLPLIISIKDTKNRYAVFSIDGIPINTHYHKDGTPVWDLNNEARKHIKELESAPKSKPRDDELEKTRKKVEEVKDSIKNFKRRLRKNTMMFLMIR